MDICFICKSSEKDDIRYGEFLKNREFGVHTFCLVGLPYSMEFNGLHIYTCKFYMFSSICLQI